MKNFTGMDVFAFFSLWDFIPFERVTTTEEFVANACDPSPDFRIHFRGTGTKVNIRNGDHTSHPTTWTVNVWVRKYIVMDCDFEFATGKPSFTDKAPRINGLTIGDTVMHIED